MTTHGVLTAKTFFKALVDAGIVQENTARVIIDLNRGDVPILYIEQYGDTRLLNLVRTLDGITISRDKEPDADQ
jgi:hypothetical protein